jgi:hypothetical protein
MRQEPDLSERGFGSGVAPDPIFDVGDDHDPWIQHRVIEKPVAVTDFNYRCPTQIRIHGSDGLTRTCNNMLGEELTRPWTITCRKCKTKVRLTP